MKNKDDYCPVELSIQILSRKYVLNILKDMYLGKSRFNEFLKSNPRLNNKSLSRCLNFLQENNLIIKNINPENDLETEYILTDKALKLKNVLYEIAKYTLESDEDSLNINQEAKEKLVREIRMIYTEK